MIYFYTQIIFCLKYPMSYYNFKFKNYLFLFIFIIDHDLESGIHLEYFCYAIKRNKYCLKYK